MSDSGDDDDKKSEKSFDISKMIHQKPNLYVGVAIAAVLIATPFILYSYCYSSSKPSSSSSLAEDSEHEVMNTNPEMSDQIKQTLDGLQASLATVQSNITATNEKIDGLSNSVKMINTSEPITTPEPTKEKTDSFFNLNNFNPFSTEKKSTPEPTPEPQPTPEPVAAAAPEPEPEPMPDYEAPLPTEPVQPEPVQTQLQPPTEEPMPIQEGEEQTQQTEKPNFEMKGGRKTRRKHRAKKNRSEKLLNKFLEKLSKLK